MSINKDNLCLWNRLGSFYYILALLPFLLTCNVYRQDAVSIQVSIKSELGSEFRTDVVEDIFFIATNLGTDELSRARNLIIMSMKALYKEFFDVYPALPVTLYLFKDKLSYEQYVRKIYNRAPSTPFGFYIPKERKILLDFSTGTGTLMHEMIHPLIASDFPSIPSWLNEGFASLFEQSVFVDGWLRGKVNWRLRVLKEYIGKGNMPSLASIIDTKDHLFYSKESSINYAIARFFCLWLQEKKLLTGFYKRFKESVGTDPTGIKTLELLVGKDINSIQSEWLAWVKGL